MSAPGTPVPGDGRESAADRTAGDLARRSGLRRDETGRLDVLSAVGGWRGVLESVLPGLVYLVCVVLTGRLGPALTASLAVAAIFTLVRLLQRQSVTQAVSGLVGVGICALFARAGGDALDYYVPGLLTNAVWLVGLTVSALVGWPLLGVLYGYVRGEGTDWRRDPVRRGAYQRVNAVLLAMFAARLVVQVPLYLAGDVAALGITRLVMGAPLYAAVLWLAWLWSRPRPAPPAG
ncbi:hypothetical protein KVA01_06280 [Kocuria varians]|uniref:Potassium ABC transporter n=1 Tax=Kocuria varians TaxID=1272 RepID=A0A4Y4D4I4_KOCVA|nr:DUF3159 domain-containing protein [Kocuria varians]GEC98473.1 hypothetical protein KVA01_06280 [Kocuria varians]